MVGWLLNLLYLFALVAAAPWLAYRAAVLGKNRRGWGEKLWGAVPARDSARPCVWFHAVSVGEVLQLQPLLEALAQQRPELEFVISTTTQTGHDVAIQKYPTAQVIYYPLDFSWAVRRALGRIQPEAVVLVELELWPNFVRVAETLGIPVLLINGRISERSFRGYRRIRPVVRGMLSRLAACAVQNESYAARLAELGRDRSQIQVTGSIKFDRVDANRENPRTQELGRAFGLAKDDIVFIAGSTQSTEEETALDCYLDLIGRHPRLRLILVPRHKERFEEVARLVRERYQLPLVRRSEASAERAPRSILLLDTLGELSACWGLADVAFVGGSLTRRGGQNMIEPAGFGAAVLFGPNTWNFKDVVEMLLTEGAAAVVQDGEELTRKVAALLDNPAAARAMGERARQLVAAQRGATERTIELIAGVLDSTGQEGATLGRIAA